MDLFAPQMQSTIREHRDGGHAGGVFNRYTIVKVSFFCHSLIYLSEFPLIVRYMLMTMDTVLVWHS